MSIQTNSSQSLENNSTGVTGPFLDLVESGEYEIKDAEFKIKVDEILASRMKISPEQNQINRMMKIAGLKGKKEDLARILNNAVIKLKGGDKYEILAEEFLNMPESELSSFQTMLGEKIMSSHQDYELPKGESAEYTDDSSQKLDFFDFDNIFADIEAYNKKIAKGEIATSPLSGFTRYRPNRGKPAKNLEEALNRCGAALNAMDVLGKKK